MSDDLSLVVVGAGGGLVGALRAAELGLDVVVVEASEHFRRGNNTSMSTAMVPGAGSRFQAAAGVEDSPELFLKDMQAKTKGTVDVPLGTALANVSARLVEWLADGPELPMELVTDFSYPGHSAHRLHTVPGRHGTAMLDHLYQRTKANDLIELFLPARLVQVTTDDHGVCAAIVERPDGSREELPTRHLLLACNGYGANHDLVAQYLPEIAKATYHGSEHSKGDALTIGTALGAEARYLDAYQGHAALSERGSTLVGWATIMHGGIMVDRDGVRFGDETCGYSEYAAMLAARPDAFGWLVFDDRIHSACMSFLDFRQTVESGAVVVAADAGELASKTGLPAEALTATLIATEQAARNGQDAHGRTFFEAPLAAPYHAVRVRPALFHTQGGLVVDQHAQVLAPTAKPIRGLYAAGGAAMGISGHGASGYLAGNGLLPALGLSLLAAEHTAADLNKE